MSGGQDQMRMTVTNKVGDPSPFCGHLADGTIATVIIDGISQDFQLSGKDASGWPPGWAVETTWWAVEQ